jgi:NAD-dependent deacetylase
MVYPVASFPVTAKARGARVIELNLEETPLTGISEHSIRGKAGDLLPALWDAVLGR